MNVLFCILEDLKGVHFHHVVYGRSGKLLTIPLSLCLWMKVTIVENIIVLPR